MNVNKSNVIKICMGYSKDILSQYICEKVYENPEIIDLKLKNIQYNKKITKLQKDIDHNAQKMKKALEINDYDHYLKLTQKDLHMEQRLRTLFNLHEVLLKRLYGLLNQNLDINQSRI